VRWLVRQHGRSRVFAIVRPGADLWRLREVDAQVGIVACDLQDTSALERELVSIRPQVCFHFAWYAVPGLYWQSRENLRSLEASIGLTLRLADLGCKRFVGIGTCAEYEIRAERLVESAPTGPKSLYAASKLAFALVLQQVAQAAEMRWLWARVFYQYGPYEDSRRLVPTVVRALLGGEPAVLTTGEQARDFLHVDDVAAAIVVAARSELNGIVNIGSGTATPVAELATTIGALMGRPDLIRLGARPSDPAEPPFVCADPTRLMSTGWRPTYNLQAGLADTIEWFRRQRAQES
jgi:nucleoside-diphosphate-sugar epimerase